MKLAVKFPTNQMVQNQMPKRDLSFRNFTENVFTEEQRVSDLIFI